MASFTLAQIEAFALDPMNQGFFNQFYGQPKEMKCFLCAEVSVSHGNNAQPFCKESRQELVCDDCNDLVLHMRQFIARNGGDPYKSNPPPECLDEARHHAFIHRVMRTDMRPVNVPNADGEMCSAPTRKPEQTKSAPTRKPEQTKSQSKRAM
tara:strand:+ start:81 stop:536 length:456 start_codon:yes stop_codon:yes gene_type:complete